MISPQQLFASASAWQRSLFSALSGLLFFGLWAFWVNYDFGWAAASKAALTQGGYSFTVTLSNTYLIEMLFRSISAPKLRFMGTVVMTSILICSLSWLINYLSGTPNIIMTILPGCFISTFYAFIYTVGLAKASTVH